MRRGRGRFPWGGGRGNRGSGYGQQHLTPQQQQFRNSPQQQFQPVFDFIQLSEAFPLVEQSAEDQMLNEMILERNTQLTPPPAQSFALMNFLTRIKSKLDALVLQPASFTGCQLYEVREVGSHKHNTLIGKQTATGTQLSSDIVVVLKILPTKEAISALGARILQDVRPVCTPEEGALLVLNTTEYGLSIDCGHLSVHLLITTVPTNWFSLDADLHLSKAICKRNFNAIKHAKWVDEVCVHPSIKVLVRLLKDLRQRFSGLKPLSPWMLALLAQYSVTSWHAQETLPLSFAFKRALQLLSSGIFLPGSCGLADPCEEPYAPLLHSSLSNEEQDRLCCTSQTLLRALALSPRYVLGLEQGPDIFAQTTMLKGIAFSPGGLISFSTDNGGVDSSDAAQQPMCVEVNG